MHHNIITDFSTISQLFFQFGKKSFEWNSAGEVVNLFYALQSSYNFERKINLLQFSTWLRSSGTNRWILRRGAQDRSSW